MNQIRKISNLIFNIPRLILYSVYRLGFVIIHPIFSLMYKTRFGKGILYLIKDIANDDDFLFIIPLLIVFATVSSLLWVLYHIIFPLAMCMTIGAMLLYAAVIPTVVIIIFGFFVNEWMKTYGKKELAVEDKPKASFSLAGIQELRPTSTTQDPAFREWERSGRRTGYSGGSGYSRDYPVQFGSNRIFAYTPEARFNGINDFPSEGYSSRMVSDPQSGDIYTEFYYGGKLVQRVKKYEV